MPERSFLSDILGRMARAGRRMSGKEGASNIDLCTELLGDKGEVSGLVTAMTLLDRFDSFSPGEKAAFFVEIATEFSVDDDRLADAIAKWTPGDNAAARHVHDNAEPVSQELIRRLNRVPGATARLVRMRADLLGMLKENPVLAGLNDDFSHLFGSWFNRGFLEIRRIDWSTSAEILEKIIAYEAVHEITGWNDLRQRVAAPDRRLFAFFHPAMPSEPLIFVEVALMDDIPGAIGPILDEAREVSDPTEMTTAVFYSISNCQLGLRGISFGNFLIKQVVAELERDLPSLKQFVTLSPVPGLRRWALGVRTRADPLLPVAFAELTEAELAAPLPPELAEELAARYLLRAKRGGTTAFDPVAHFHLGNGAMLHRVNTEADHGKLGQDSAFGVMVNYLYDQTQIEANHQAYATQHTVVATPAIRVLAGLPKK